MPLITINSIPWLRFLFHLKSGKPYVVLNESMHMGPRALIVMELLDIMHFIIIIYHDTKGFLS